MIEVLLFLGTLLLIFGIPTAIVYPEVYVLMWRTTTGRWTGKPLYGYTYNEVKGLSNKSRDILISNAELPTDNRLGPELLDGLRALDAKLGGAKKVNSHACYEHYYSNRNVDCPISEFSTLESSITDIKSAVEEQRKRIEELAVEGLSTSTPLLIERAKREADIIRQATKELT